MKKLFVTLCATFIGLGMLSFDAEAKRLGGGMSSGMKRDSGVMNRSATPAPTAPTTAGKPAATPQAAAPAPSGMSRWLGPLAGIAAGVGLAALFSHLGMGEGMGSMLMILALVAGAFFLFRLLSRKRQPEAGMQYAGAGAPAPAHFEPVSIGGSAAPAAAAAAVNVPADFDVDGFLRNAKLNYVRLQAANDAGNLDDIRAFTSPEMFAEIKLQLDERGKVAQQTDVMQLNAQLLDLTTEDKRYIASVRFHGQIREEANAAPEAFDEVWHLTKPVDGATGWVIAGIQQFE
ncbi:MAG: Tim44-like domain-containing protein [Rhodocyclaceae bacterium]|jgi:predicted lipid-binding transport protein (Tim44 family)|nr:Tim44-like domain-containing protein [Rhodocyclaceae bacterium]